MPRAPEQKLWSPSIPQAAPQPAHPPPPPRRRLPSSARDAARSPHSHTIPGASEPRPADPRARARIAEALAANLPGLEIGDVSPRKNIHHTPFQREWPMLDGHDLMSIFPPHPPPRPATDKCDDVFRRQMHTFLSELDPRAIPDDRRRHNSVPIARDADIPRQRRHRHTPPLSPRSEVKSEAHSPHAIQRACSDPAPRERSRGVAAIDVDTLPPPPESYIPRKRAPKKTCGREECTLPYCRSVHHRRKLGQIQQSASPPMPGEVHWQIDLTRESDEH